MSDFLSHINLPKQCYYCKSNTIININDDSDLYYATTCCYCACDSFYISIVRSVTLSVKTVTPIYFVKLRINDILFDFRAASKYNFVYVFKDAKCILEINFESQTNLIDYINNIYDNYKTITKSLVLL